MTSSPLSRAAAAAAVVVVAVTLSVAGPPATATAGAAGATAVPQDWVVTNPDPEGAIAIEGGSATLHDLDTGVAVSCAGLQGIGDAPSDTVDGNHSAMTVYQLYDPGCAGDDGTAFEVGTLPWGLAVEAYDQATDRVSGWVWDDFDLVYGWLAQGDCTFGLIAPVFGDPDEQPDFTYDNVASTLTVTHRGLAVSSADGADCAGVVEVGDRVAFSASLPLTPAVTIRPVT